MSEIISKEKKVKKVFELVEEIQKAKEETVKGFLIIGKNLDIIQRERLYIYYGEHIQNFEMFLKEIGIKHGTAFNLIRIWRTFGEIITYKNLYVDYFRLVKLLPVAKDLSDEEKEEWLDKANSLTFSDFEDEIGKAKGKISELECQHPDEEQELYTRCKICGKWIKRDINYFKNYIQKYENKS
uniref:Uncharacterized protein n=1 Tax=Dictyoglomus turgidum TaxID=513050 RepID=A0A7C3SND5_9BACT